ncbi:hypothetical protein H0G86_004557 [Trichoderma simmonsii]|uniref:Uncharacterized protein n=1 Tax=Trichoderma simmonsii TaxID=1491479 RepID=A0A8G0PI18_9HYPO|nr:hypothetical protein H0G86_004557 [Trichoderma simmonsii]
MPNYPDDKVPFFPSSRPRGWFMLVSQKLLGLVVGTGSRLKVSRFPSPLRPRVIPDKPFFAHTFCSVAAFCSYRDFFVLLRLFWCCVFVVAFTTSPLELIAIDYTELFKRLFFTFPENSNRAQLSKAQTDLTLEIVYPIHGQKL